MTRGKWYAAPTGRRYHSDALCEGLNSYHMANCNDRPPPTVGRAEVERRGLEPCRTCKPAPILRVVS